MILLFFALLQAGISHSKSAVPTLVFFGGHGAGSGEMKSWAKSLGATTVGKQYSIETVPYPSGATSHKKSVLSKGEDTIKSFVKRITDNPDQEFVLMAHSSGCALPNEIVRRIKADKIPNLKVILLDGFKPQGFSSKPPLEKKAKYACWSSRDKKTKLKSSNFDALKGGCDSFHVLDTSGCETKMCQHFKLLNKNAPSGLGSDYGANGYNKVSAVTSILEDSFPAQKKEKWSSSPDSEQELAD